MPETLHIVHTDYSRGAVVKLVASLADAPKAKFIIQKRRGRFEVSTKTSLGLESIGSHDNLKEATGQAIRECERIRDTFSGGLDAAP